MTMKSGIFALLAVVVLAVSAAAAPVPVASMGIVLQANNATLDGSPAVNSATIFNGNTLSTDNAGALRARFGSSQIYLFANSRVTVSHAVNGFIADLSGGSVLLSSAAGENFEVLADGATVKSEENQQTVAQISWVSPTELMLTSRRGDLEVTMGDETKTVNEGSSYRMMIVPASQPAASPASPTASGSSGGNAFLFVAVAIVAAGTGVALWRAFESTSSTN
jgi:hypothetical protein